jgi:hypothetical protein
MALNYQQNDFFSSPAAARVTGWGEFSPIAFLGQVFEKSTKVAQIFMVLFSAVKVIGGTS